MGACGCTWVPLHHIGPSVTGTGTPRSKKPGPLAHLQRKEPTPDQATYPSSGEEEPTKSSVPMTPTPTSPPPTVTNTSAFLLDSSDMATRTLILCRRLSTYLSAKMGVRCGRLLLNPRNPARLRDIPGRGGSWEPSVGQRKKRKAPKGDSPPPSGTLSPCPHS